MVPQPSSVMLMRVL